MNRNQQAPEYKRKEDSDEDLKDSFLLDSTSPKKNFKVNKPYYELARPKTLEEIGFNKELREKISSLATSFQDMPHLLFYGPPGTGKTTTARAIARKILGTITPFNYYELNASADRGVQIIRNNILKFVSSFSFAKLGAPDTPYKIVFLDEADGLTPDAQNVLRNMMETYASTSRFILSCNNVNKIIPALESRCLYLKFDPVEEHVMVQKIKKFTSDYNLNYSEEEIKSAVVNSKGDFRIAFKNLYLQLPEKDESIQIKELVEFITRKTVSFNNVYQLMKLRRDLIDRSQKVFFETLVMELCEEKEVTSKTFDNVDRLARAEAAIVHGATPFTQFTGWLAYYYKNK